MSLGVETVCGCNRHVMLRERNHNVFPLIRETQQPGCNVASLRTELQHTLCNFMLSFSLARSCSFAGVGIDDSDVDNSSAN